MMKIRTLIIGVGAILAIGNTPAQEYILKPKFKAGDSHLIVMDTAMKRLIGEEKVTMDMSINAVQSTKVHKKGHELKYSLERAKLDMQMMGQKINYDSSDKNPKDPAWQEMNTMLKPLLAAKMSIILDEAGKTTETKEAGLNPMLMQLGVDVNHLVDTLNLQFQILPTKPVAVDHKWSSKMDIPISKGHIVKANVTVKLDDVSVMNGKKIATLKFETLFKDQFEETGVLVNAVCKKYAGSSKFNITDGIFEESSVDMKMSLGFNDDPVAIDLELKTKISTKLQKNAQP